VAREEKVREVSSAYDQLVAKMKAEIDRGPVTISELKGKLSVNLNPGAGPLLRLGVALLIEAFERDPQATLARLADVASRGDEPFQIPPELLVTE